MELKFEEPAESNPFVWNRSSLCSVSACVIWRQTVTGGFEMSDSKLVDPAPVITMDDAVWQRLTSSIVNDDADFDVDHISVRRRLDGWTEVVDNQADITLSFFAEEWVAFRRGVDNRAFIPA